MASYLPLAYSTGHERKKHLFQFLDSFLNISGFKTDSGQYLRSFSYNKLESAPKTNHNHNLITSALLTHQFWPAQYQRTKHTPQGHKGIHRAFILNSNEFKVWLCRNPYSQMPFHLQCSVIAPPSASVAITTSLSQNQLMKIISKEISSLLIL